MTAIILATLMGMQPVEAHTTHRHQARPQQHHHRSRKPRAQSGHTWVWIPGHWVRRDGSSVWVWGRWDLRPVPAHRNCHRNHRR